MSVYNAVKLVISHRLSYVKNYMELLNVYALTKVKFKIGIYRQECGLKCVVRIKIRIKWLDLHFLKE